MKTYLVTLQTPAFKSVVIEARDEEAAQKEAIAQAFIDDMSDWEVNPNDPPEVGDVVEEEA